MPMEIRYQNDEILAIASIGQTLIHRRSGGAYRLDSYCANSERATLVPLHKGGRTTKKWVAHLFMDYRLEDQP